MDRLVFTSLSGAKTGTIQRTMLTNDLANVSTVDSRERHFSVLFRLSWMAWLCGPLSTIGRK